MEPYTPRMQKPRVFDKFATEWAMCEEDTIYRQPATPWTQDNRGKKHEVASFDDRLCRDTEDRKAPA